MYKLGEHSALREILIRQTFVCLWRACLIFASSTVPLANARGSDYKLPKFSEPRALASGMALEPI